MSTRMEINMQKIAAILLIWTVTSISYAYELGTHARITEAAYSKSNLVLDATLLPNLGFLPINNPFGDKYFDVSGTEVRERGVFDNFELKHMPTSAKPLSISGWLMRGAIREDDAKGEKNPQDDTYNPNLRRPDVYLQVVYRGTLNDTVYFNQKIQS